MEIGKPDYGFEPNPKVNAKKLLTRLKQASEARLRQRIKGERTSGKVLEIVLNDSCLTDQQISEKVGICKRQVQRHVKRLVDCGMLESHVKHIPGMTGHPLSFRELRVPNAVSESKERFQNHVQSGSCTTGTHPQNP